MQLATSWPHIHHCFWHSHFISYVILAEIVNVIIFCHNYYQSIIIIIIIIIVTIGRWNLARSIPAIGIIGRMIIDIWSFLSTYLRHVHHIMEKHNQCFFCFVPNLLNVHHHHVFTYLHSAVASDVTFCGQAD